ncbi:MAG: hypothetical protein LBE22_08250 [Azoarcus sp.]|nr:hypothetical protein [Azoarcus sp.]
MLKSALIVANVFLFGAMPALAQDCSDAIAQSEKNECAEKEDAPFYSKSFTVDDFSDQYYGKLSVEDENEDEVFTSGEVIIYRKSDNKVLITVKAEQISLDLHDGKVKSNIMELPYGEQSNIIYDDFNFDGIKDFAIMEGRNSCYGGPSFSIFLGKGKDVFEFNENFTRLAQDYCGMFDYDHKEKTISVMTKSGCCWHQVSQFVLENNVPVEIMTSITDQSTSIYKETVIRRVSGKTIETVVRVLLNEAVDELLSFDLEDGRKALVYAVRKDRLDYILFSKDGQVEFSYDLDAKNEDNTFHIEYSDGNGKMAFFNGDIGYEIFETEKSIGIRVTQGKKISVFKGKLETKQGSLSDILYDKDKYTNLKK